jgi:hypothetical protein
MPSRWTGWQDYGYTVQRSVNEERGEARKHPWLGREQSEPKSDKEAWPSG